MTTLQSIAQAASAIRAGKLMPRELLDQCLAQIDKFEDRLHAWVVVDADNARRMADELGREALAGKYRGVLHGIPIGIKDIFDVAGMPTRAGSPLREHYPAAAADAPLVTALRQAGAIILGKTVTVEFACFDPSPTRNPWDIELRHTPGGSSSGSAVAVAMGMCLGALGTQTGGSLVRPASYCGIATLKPTFGLLSCEGVVPVSYHLDHPGPMARTVGDLQILMQCLAGGTWIKSPLRAPTEGLSGEGQAEGVLSYNSPPSFGYGKASKSHVLSQPPRLGLISKFFLDQAQPEVRQSIEQTIARLRQTGAYIESLQPAIDFAEVAAMHRSIMAVEAVQFHRQRFAAHRDKYGPKIASLLDEGLKISGVEYASALAWQRDFHRRVNELIGSYDALITPSTDTTAPATLETTGTPKFQAPWSCAGVPAVSIPCGLAPDGMPVGLQLIGRQDQDAALLGVAEWCERRIGFDKTPPLMKES